MIDTTNGIVKIDSVIVTSMTTTSDFKSSALFKESTPVDLEGDCPGFVIPKVSLYGWPFKCVIRFQNDRVFSIQLISLTEAKSEMGRLSETNFKHDHLLSEKHHDEILRRFVFKGNRHHVFSWGAVRATSDKKLGGHIEVRYS